MSDVAISVNSVSKTFKLPHEKASSVKHMFIHFFHGTKGYERQKVLTDISFEVKKGEFFGIVGRNGSGKSTLLKLLAGVYSPDSGHVDVSGKLVPFIELGVGFNPELTGRENVYLNGALLGFSENEVDSFYNEVVGFAELEKFMDQKLKNYSSGMQVRLAFSMAVRANADILLIDEVLAVGDADFQRKCFEYFGHLKRIGATVIFVSHDMEAVRQYCDRAILIEKNKLIQTDSANEISMSYTKMFLRKDENENFDRDEDRWGDKSVIIGNPKVEVTDKDVNLSFSLESKTIGGKLLIGFAIKNGEGKQVIATNSKINRDSLLSLNKKEKKLVSYKFSNVLNDDTFSIDISVQDEYGKLVKDWWVNAVRFKVSKKIKTPSVINLPINFSVE